jgi:hypothetical protein
MFSRLNRYRFDFADNFRQNLRRDYPSHYGTHYGAAARHQFSPGVMGLYPQVFGNDHVFDYDGRQTRYRPRPRVLRRDAGMHHYGGPIYMSGARGY